MKTTTSGTSASKSTSKSNVKCACSVCTQRIGADEYTYPLCANCDAEGCDDGAVRRVS